ncbi:hypothetical protein UYSO10_4430 [Kosakonia radicincitans]|nr:hypothetical protein UYSO10_4430 [Kosakonia radicincitans]
MWLFCAASVTDLLSNCCENLHKTANSDAICGYFLQHSVFLSPLRIMSATL